MTTISAICYHYLSRDDEFKRMWGHSFELFKQHIDYLEKKYSIINPGDVLNERFEDGKHYLLLTFDDGLIEHRKIADYLATKNMHGIFAVPTCIFRGELLNPQIIHFGSAYYGVRKFYDFCGSVICQIYPQYMSLLVAQPKQLEVMELH